VTAQEIAEGPACTVMLQEELTALEARVAKILEALLREITPVP
jgi:hypothetical protein